MQGIELSRRFFIEIVQPWLRQVAPELRYAAALIGYGSELLGFDDETSKDHNWGPRVHLILSRESFDAHARRLVEAFTQTVPTRFCGEPIGWRARPHPPANNAEAAGTLEHGLEFHTLEGRLEASFATDSVEKLDPVQWLGFAEQKLLAFTAGAVFHDDDGRLTQARRRLAYFPDDVWLYKIACQWRRIAEEQAFVGRAGQVGDDIGSRIIAARLVRDVMRMGFLLERRYAPYSKWLGKAFSRLPIAEALHPFIVQALDAAEWKEREAALASAYLELARKQNALGIALFEPVIGPFHDRPFTVLNADAAIASAMAAIVDDTIRSLPILGSVDQVSDLTPLLESARLSQRMMNQLDA
jgi:hypothetical protein